MAGIKKNDVIQLIAMAIDEDIGTGDVTSRAIFDASHRSRAIIVAKDDGVFCGGDILRYVYEEISSNVTVRSAVDDGTAITRGDVVTELEGPAAALLAGERTALNFLQRLCGIATATHRTVSLVSGTGIKILDTRKTLPGFRRLDKYAVKTGAGTNHRMGLYDMVMIKDNHIKAAGGITRAVEKIRALYGKRYVMEVEAATADEAGEAADCGADIIMLDNMEYDTMTESIKIIDKRSKIEVSGNMDETKIRGMKNLGIDYISMGSLTHSVKAFDLSMKFL